MNKQEEIIRLSKDKGYYVDKDGKLFNSNGKELSLTKNGKGEGYLSFNIRVNGSKPTRSFIHKLQAYQKFGDEIFKKGIVVRHADNILIGTQSDNMQDIPSERRIITASNPTYDHKDIIESIKNGLTYQEIMNKFGIKSKGTISFILNKSLEIQGKII
jgi:hypothetical protein